MTVRELGHLVLYVRDLGRSVAFYRDVLGWRQVLPAPGEVPVGAAGFSSGRTHHELLLIEVGPDAAPTTSGSTSARPTTTCAPRWPRAAPPEAPWSGQPTTPSPTASTSSTPTATRSSSTWTYRAWTAGQTRHSSVPPAAPANESDRTSADRARRQRGCACRGRVVAGRRHRGRPDGHGLRLGGAAGRRPRACPFPFWPPRWHKCERWAWPSRPEPRRWPGAGGRGL